MIDELGNYLGVPLVYDKLCNSMFDLLVNKIRVKLAQWKASCLSLASRIILAQSVLAAIWTYFMQTMRLPTGV